MNYLSKNPLFVLAPMDDVTDTVFRQIIAGCAKPDLFVTEFVNVDGLQSPGRKRLLYKLKFTAAEQPLVIQLWGVKLENFYKTAQQIADGSLAAEANFIYQKTKIQDRDAGQANAILNFSGVDLNMGCPVKTVIKNGACAALINNRELASEIIQATREGLSNDFPFSIKTRVGFTTVDMTWIEFLLNKKLDLLSIHGRTAKQKSLVPANWNLIGQAREMRDALCPTTKIIGNGDVLDRQHGMELIKKYGLDGVMIGRGIFNDPFVFTDPLVNESPWGSYTKEQKISLYRKHVELFAKTWQGGERKIETLNKFCKIYINGFDGAKELREKLMAAKSAGELLDLLI